MTNGKKAGGVQENFVLGKPALVCRWRLASHRLPMENRHLRALGARYVNGDRVSTNLVAWAKQHVEWTLGDGSSSYPDGVLMIVVDENGCAAMSVGPFEKLGELGTAGLLRRAREAQREGSTTNVAPETIWAMKGDTLMWGIASDQYPSGSATLINDLARTVGIPVVRNEDLLDELERSPRAFDEVFLVSDEFGVVPAADASGLRSRKFAAGYQKLLDSMSKRR